MTASSLLFGLLLCVVVVTVCHGDFSFNSPQQCSPKASKEDWRRCHPCSWSCSAWKMTLMVRNVFREPYFEDYLTLCCPCPVNLLYLMQAAADVDNIFRFTVQYFGTSLGYFVQAFNNVYGDYALDQSYWKILDGEYKPTPVGVSSYVPWNGEIVTFNLTNETHPH